MKFKTRDEGEITILSVSGGLLQESVDRFQKTINELYEKGRVKLVLDMEFCNYITSMSLAVIFHSRKKFLAQGGNIKVAKMNALIKKLFEMTNVKKTIEVFDTVENAIDSYL